MGSIITVKNGDFSAVSLGQIVKSPISIENGGNFWKYTAGTHTFSRDTNTSWQLANAGSQRIEIPEGATYVFGITSGMIADSSTITENAKNAMGIRTILFSDSNDYLRA